MSRIKMLLLLLLLLVLAVIYAWYMAPRQQRIGSLSLPTEDSTSLRQDAPIGLDFSGGETVAYKRPKRDLFRPLYTAPRAVATPAPPTLPVAQPMVVLPPAQFPTNFDRPLAQPQGVKPIPPLKVLGFLEKDAQYTVFLASTKGDIYLVKRGDRFADGLLVRELNRQQVVISRDMNDAGLTLPLGEVKNQRISARALPSDRPSVPIIEIEPQNLTPPPELQPPAAVETKSEP